MAALGLVGHHQHWLASSPQKISNLFVIGCNTCPHIYHKQNHICFFNGDFCLSAHFDNYIIGILKVYATGIDEDKGTTYPLAIRIESIPSNAWLTLDNGLPSTDNTVEQGRFAHIWSPYYGNYWFCHGPVTLSTSSHPPATGITGTFNLSATSSTR